MNKMIYTSLPQGFFPHETKYEVFDLGNGNFKSVKTDERGDFESECYLDGGAIRWKSNNACAPTSAVAELHLNEIPGYNAVAHEKAREADLDAFATRYKANDRPPDAEQLYEMRAAFGEGTEVVNIITGRRTRL